ncbi:MAG: ribonuclease III [Rudaea sp.]
MNLADLEASLGFVFQDKSLLQRALTHRSYLNENPNLPWLDNERLEFLGDSILGFVTAEYLYHHFPEMKEGDLTSLRAALVRGETLAEYAGQIGLGPHLLISRGEETAGGRSRRALLAGAFEAVVGAIYLDHGLDAASQFILRLVDAKTPEIVQERLDRNSKSLLQELSQGRLKLTPVYRMVQARGPDHAREFTVQVLLGERVYGEGQGRNKQAAEQEAARAALAELEREIEEGPAALAGEPEPGALPTGEVPASPQQIEPEPGRESSGLEEPDPGPENGEPPESPDE